MPHNGCAPSGSRHSYWTRIVLAPWHRVEVACDASGVFTDSSTILPPVAPQVRKLDDAVTIFSVPFKRMGLVPFGGRSVSPTVVSQTPFAPLIDPLSLWTDGGQAAIRQRLARSFAPALPRNS